MPYPFAKQGLYDIKPTKMEELIKRIEALMTENEVVKNNTFKDITKGSANEDIAVRLWAKAKTENAAYQNVLDLIKDLKEGKL